MTTPRRSTRIQQSCSYAPAWDDDSDDMSNSSEDLEQSEDSDDMSNFSEESEDSDAEMLHTPHGAGQKRQKVQHTRTETAQDGQMVRYQRPDKYVRGRRGYLKLMTEMPLDTLYEIFRQLDPLDLLHLSWASKRLRSIIMKKSFVYIWQEAYARLYESENPPPHCPKDVNLAQYTRFLYNQKCMVCNTRIGAYTSWMMRLRACKPCLDSDLFYSPCDEYLTITANKRSYVWARDLEISSHWSQMWEKVDDRMEGTCDFNSWKARCSKNRANDQDRRRAERSAAIFKKLEEIGWTESKIKEINDGQLPDDLPGFGTVKKLIKHDWECIRPEIEDILSEMEEDHLSFLKKKHLNNRWDQFDKLFQEWDQAQTLDKSFRPCAMDILVTKPFFTATLMSDAEKVDFGVDVIDHAAKEWIEWRNDFVFSVLPQDLQDRYRVNKSPLPLLAIFRFSKPAPATLDEIYGTRCYLRRCCCVSVFSGEREVYDAIIRLGPYRTGCCPWKWRNTNLTFDVQHSKIASDVLEYLGMDPFTTTLTEVRECKRMFKCLQCERSWKYRCEGMIEHDMMFHRYEGKERPPPSTRWIQAENENVSNCGLEAVICQFF